MGTKRESEKRWSTNSFFYFVENRATEKAFVQIAFLLLTRNGEAKLYLLVLPFQKTRFEKMGSQKKEDDHWITTKFVLQMTGQKVKSPITICLPQIWIDETACKVTTTKVIETKLPKPIYNSVNWTVTEKVGERILKKPAEKNRSWRKLVERKAKLPIVYFKDYWISTITNDYQINQMVGSVEALNATAEKNTKKAELNFNITDVKTLKHTPVADLTLKQVKTWTKNLKSWVTNRFQLVLDHLAAGCDVLVNGAINICLDLCINEEEEILTLYSILLFFMTATRLSHKKQVPENCWQISV